MRVIRLKSLLQDVIAQLDMLDDDAILESQKSAMFLKDTTMFIGFPNERCYVDLETIKAGLPKTVKE